MNAIAVFTSMITLAGAAALSACGGGSTETVAAASPSSAAVTVEAPLLEDTGHMAATLPSAQPADAGARTRSTGYATPSQAAALEAALGSDVLSTEVGCCGADAADVAVLTVYGNQAAGDLPNSTPVLVRGADQRLAATVAQRLSDNGFSRVWLVVR